jgi:hypothetical protein
MSSPNSRDGVTRREALGVLAGAALFAFFLPRPVRAEPPSAAKLRWESLSDEEKARVLRNYRRFKQMDKGQREVVVVHYQRWRGMSQEQRQFMHRNLERWRGMTLEEREWLVHNLRRYRDLPAKRQEQLANFLEGLRRMEIQKRIHVMQQLKKWKELTRYEQNEVRRTFEQCGCKIP